MGALIFMILIFIIFDVALLVLISSIISLLVHKKRNITKKSIGFVISKIGIIIGFVLLSIPIAYFVFLRIMNNQEDTHNVRTKNTIYWQEIDYGSRDFFEYKNKKYLYLDIPSSQSSEKIILDKAVANIEPSIPLATKILSLIVGENITETLYTIKNYEDESIMATDITTLYCVEDKLEQIKDYYENIDNYNFFATFAEFGDENNCLQLTDVNKVKQIYNYSGVESDIINKEYKYLNIFGVSKDNIIHKHIATILFDGNETYIVKYTFKDALNTEGKKHVIKLIDKQKEYIQSIH